MSSLQSSVTPVPEESNLFLLLWALDLHMVPRHKCRQSTPSHRITYVSWLLSSPLLFLRCQKRWYMLVIPTLGSSVQEDRKFEAGPGYIREPCTKPKQQKDDLEVKHSSNIHATLNFPKPHLPWMNSQWIWGQSGDRQTLTFFQTLTDGGIFFFFQWRFILVHVDCF